MFSFLLVGLALWLVSGLALILPPHYDCATSIPNSTCLLTHSLFRS